MRYAVERHDSVKVNIAFNSKFATNDKRVNKSIITRAQLKNNEVYRCMSDMRDRHVIEPTLATLEEFQERDSEWALLRILNLIVNVNKPKSYAREVTSKCHGKC